MKRKSDTISQSEAAQMIGVSLTTLYRRRAEDQADNTFGHREPGGFKDGGEWCWKYRVEDVREWLARKARRNLVVSSTSATQGAPR